MKKFFVFISALLFVISSSGLAGAHFLLPEEVQVIYLVNEERESRGIDPLWHNAQLSEAAFRHSDDMATNNFFSHTGSDGSNFVTRAQEAGYTGSPRGECIGWGYPTAESMVDGWMNSPPHRDILLMNSANRIGISHVSSYWTLVVGTNGSIDPLKPVVQVTDNTGIFDVMPQVLGDGSLLWQAWDGHDYEIYFQEPGQNPTQLTNNNSPDAMPKMNAAGDLVWMNWDGNDWELWCNLGSGPVQLTDNIGAYDVSPQITDDRLIYWQGWDGHDYELYCYTGATGVTTQFTNNSLPDAAPQVNANGQLTWMRYDGQDWEICYNMGSGPVQVTNNTGQDLVPQITPEGQIYWQAWDGSDYEICRYTVGGSTENLTNNTVDDYRPSVNNEFLVWSQWDGQDFEIYLNPLETGMVMQITDDDQDDINPRVNSQGQIVWMNWDGSDYEIFTY